MLVTIIGPVFRRNRKIQIHHITVVKTNYANTNTTANVNKSNANS